MGRREEMVQISQKELKTLVFRFLHSERLDDTPTRALLRKKHPDLLPFMDNDPAFAQACLGVLGWLPLSSPHGTLFIRWFNNEAPERGVFPVLGFWTPDDFTDTPTPTKKGWTWPIIKAFIRAFEPDFVAGGCELSYEFDPDFEDEFGLILRRNTDGQLQGRIQPGWFGFEDGIPYLTISLST